MKKELFWAVLLTLTCVPAWGSVTLSFDSDTSGFTNVSWNTSNGSVAWSPLHGGSLAITITTSGWTNPVAMLNMTGNPALQSVFSEALANGGTMSFDFIIRQEDVAGYNPAIPPDWFELVVVGNTDTSVGGGWDQNVVGGAAGYYGGIPLGFTTKSITLGLAAGPPAENNGIVTFGNGSSWNELMIGINSQSGSYTGATFYIDNVTFSAIPEPSSLSLVGILWVGALAFRRKDRLHFEAQA